MNLYKKYTEAKNRYKDLCLMIGGGKPSISILKNINLFPKGDIEQHLNPLYGFIHAVSSFVPNYYKLGVLGGDDNKQLIKLVRSIFHNVDGYVQPTIELFKNMTPMIIGEFLAYRYFMNRMGGTYLVNMIEKIRIALDSVKEMHILEEKYAEFGKKQYHLYPSYTANINYKLNKTRTLIDKTMSTRYEEFIIQSINMDNIENLSDMTHDNYEKKREIFIKNLSAYMAKLQSYCAKRPAINLFIHKYISSNKLWDPGYYDIKMYYTVLALLWWVANSKAGILEYYIGVNNVLPINQRVVIPDDFIEDMYSIHELRATSYIDDFPDKTDITYEDRLTHLIASVYAKNTAIQLYSQEYVDIKIPCEINFPDCGEISVRDFIRVLMFDGTTFDTAHLDAYGPSDNVILYFNTYQESAISNNSIIRDFMGEKLNSRNAWGKIVSNIPGVVYGNYCTYGNNKYSANITGGETVFDGTEYVPNMLIVLRHLFSNIKQFEDFDSDTNDNINTVTPELTNGTGSIIIEHAVLGRLVWYFASRHYGLALDKTATYNYDNLPENIMHYILSISSGISGLEEKAGKLKFSCENWLYYVIRDENDIVDIINHNNTKIIKNEIYSNIVDYGVKYLDFDKFTRLEPDIYMSAKFMGLPISYYDCDIHAEYDIPEYVTTLIGTYTKIISAIDRVPDRRVLRKIIIIEFEDDIYEYELPELEGLETLLLDRSNYIWRGSPQQYEGILSKSTYSKVNITQLCRNCPNIRFMAVRSSLISGSVTLPNLTGLRIWFDEMIDKFDINVLQGLESLQMLEISAIDDFGYFNQVTLTNNNNIAFHNLIELRLFMDVVWDKSFISSFINIQVLRMNNKRCIHAKQIVALCNNLEELHLGCQNKINLSDIQHLKNLKVLEQIRGGKRFRFDIGNDIVTIKEKLPKLEVFSGILESAKLTKHQQINSIAGIHALNIVVKIADISDTGNISSVKKLQTVFVQIDRKNKTGCDNIFDEFYSLDELHISISPIHSFDIIKFNMVRNLVTLTSLTLHFLYKDRIMIDDGLKLLVNLNTLKIIGNFEDTKGDNPFKRSLDTLINLKNLFLPNNILRIGTSLSNLVKLERLTFSGKYGKQGDGNIKTDYSSFDSLQKLKYIKFESLFMPITDRLDKLQALNLVDIREIDHANWSYVSTNTKNKMLIVQTISGKVLIPNQFKNYDYFSIKDLEAIGYNVYDAFYQENDRLYRDKLDYY
jgi:hypothetical protein